MAIEEVDIKTNTDRLVSLDLGAIDENDEITVRAEGESFTGPVTRIDTYGDTVDVERVVQFNISYKHHIDGPDWEEWKVYLVEEPAGFYRANLMYNNGDASRTRNLAAPDEIVVE